MVNIFIDEKPMEVKEGMTILKAAQQAGIHIPHFCYHPAFPPEGTCRMCLVEIEGAPKLELACSTQVRDGMKIFTESEKVVEARKGVLEFLLTEHPIDCPICDQAGECKLQDYYEEFGLFDSRFVEEKDRRPKRVRIGENLIHDQERCVLCRRCVRFLREVTGTEEMGVFERAVEAEVNIIEGQMVDNDYSGNLAQLCPVGAITDFDFRFKTRSWFLDEGLSVCPLCSRGCSISIHYHPGNDRFKVPQKVFRILAAENEAVNGYWICDFGRYGYSYLNENRAQKILGNNENNDLDWDKALETIAGKIMRLYHMQKTSRMALILNSWLLNEELFLIKKIFVDELGINNLYFLDIPDESGDDILLTAERNPNRKGAKEIGLEFKIPSIKDLSDNIELLLVFGTLIDDQLEQSDLRSVFDKIENKYLISAHNSTIDKVMDIVLPGNLPAEKRGSMVNMKGLNQNFSAAIKGPEGSRPESEILVELAKKLNVNFKFYKQMTDTGIIFQELAKEIPFFGK